MPLKIVRNDITKMNTEAIVNTAGATVDIGAGCDIAIYNAAGYEKLHKLREEIGYVQEGEAFITPGFDLAAKYIIHAVSPLYIDGLHGEEEKLRSCYRKSLALAKENDIKSISFPLIATGSFGYPRAYGLRVALDEINAFLMGNEMDINLVVFDTVSTELAEKLHPQIEAFIGHEEVCQIRQEEYGNAYFNSVSPSSDEHEKYRRRAFSLDLRLFERSKKNSKTAETFDSLPTLCSPKPMSHFEDSELLEDECELCFSMSEPAIQSSLDYDEDIDEDALHERVKHVADPFGVYLIYLAQRQGKSLTELENTAWVSKHVVHNVKKKPDKYKPDKRTAFQFCVGLELGLDDTRDLLARAGYAISPSVLEDKIWEFYIENEHFDVIDISDSLEKYGLKPIINF